MAPTAAVVAVTADAILIEAAPEAVHTMLAAVAAAVDPLTIPMAKTTTNLQAKVALLMKAVLVVAEVCLDLLAVTARIVVAQVTMIPLAVIIQVAMAVVRIIKAVINHHIIIAVAEAHIEAMDITVEAGMAGVAAEAVYINRTVVAGTAMYQVKVSMTDLQKAATERLLSLQITTNMIGDQYQHHHLQWEGVHQHRYHNQ